MPARKINPKLLSGNLLVEGVMGPLDNAICLLSYDSADVLPGTIQQNHVLGAGMTGFASYVNGDNWNARIGGSAILTLVVDARNAVPPYSSFFTVSVCDPYLGVFPYSPTTPNFQLGPGTPNPSGNPMVFPVSLDPVALSQQAQRAIPIWPYPTSMSANVRVDFNIAAQDAGLITMVYMDLRGRLMAGLPAKVM